jgi:hypothetical protein
MTKCILWFQRWLGRRGPGSLALHAFLGLREELEVPALKVRQFEATLRRYGQDKTFHTAVLGVSRLHGALEQFRDAPRTARVIWTIS